MAYVFEDGKPERNQPGAYTFDDEPPAPASLAKPPGFFSTIARTGGQMLSGAGTAIEDIAGPNVLSRGLSETGRGIAERNPAGIQSLKDIASSPWLTVKEAVG